MVYLPFINTLFFLPGDTFSFHNASTHSATSLSVVEIIAFWEIQEITPSGKSG